MAQQSAAQIKAAYARALEHQKAERFGEALTIYHRICKARPDLAEPLFQICKIHVELGRAKDAISAAKRAAEIKPAEEAIWLEWARIIALGGGSAAEKEFLAALKQAPIASATRIKLQDRFGALRKASRPQTGGVAKGVAAKLVKLIAERKNAEAEAQSVAVLRKHPGSALVYNILGTARVGLGKLEAAESDYLRSIALDNAYAEAHENLARLYIQQGREKDATRKLRDAITFAPGLIPALINLSMGVIRFGNAEEALPLLERVILEGNDPVQAYNTMGNAFTKLKKFPEAESSFRKSLEIDRDPPAETYALLAQAQARSGKDGEAMVNFNKALAMDEDCFIATNGKAILLETLGDFDGARELFRRGFELDPNSGEGYRQYVSANKTQPGDPIIDKMKERFHSGEPSNIDRAHMGFAIAKALEDTKDYADVFDYLTQANDLVHAEGGFSVQSRFKEVEKTQKALAGFDWKGWNAEGASDYAPIFVTGMPRSGTTLIEQIISSHSTVTGAGEVGEGSKAAQNLLIRDLSLRNIDTIPREEILQLGYDYQDMMQARFPDAGIVTDKSIQTYMYIGLMKLALPRAKFVVVRRDPRDNLLSMFKNMFPAGTHLYAYSQTDLANYYTTYVDMIDFWRKEVPDWFYEVQYEKLVSDPEVETRKLIEACGLEWEDACLNFHENKRKVETLSVFQVRQPISKGSVKAWQRYEKELEPMLEVLRKAGHVTD